MSKREDDEVDSIISELERMVDQVPMSSAIAKEASREIRRLNERVIFLEAVILVAVPFCIVGIALAGMLI